MGGYTEGLGGKREMCSSQVFHCLLNCLGPGTLLPIQRSVQPLVSHTAVTLVGSSLLHKATSAPETQDPFVEVVAGLYSVSRCGGVNILYATGQQGRTYSDTSVPGAFSLSTNKSCQVNLFPLPLWHQEFNQWSDGKSAKTFRPP